MKFSRKLTKIVEKKFGVEVSSSEKKRGEVFIQYDGGKHGKSDIFVRRYGRDMVIVAASERGKKAKYIDGMFKISKLNKILEEV